MGDDALYRAIAADLREQIDEGELRPGQRVPSERELAEQWGCARLTAAWARDLLIKEGLVVARQGAGTFVVGRAEMRAWLYDDLRQAFEGARLAGSNDDVAFIAEDLYEKGWRLR